MAIVSPPVGSRVEMMEWPGSLMKQGTVIAEGDSFGTRVEFDDGTWCEGDLDDGSPFTVIECEHTLDLAWRET